MAVSESSITTYLARGGRPGLFGEDVGEASEGRAGAEEALALFVGLGDLAVEGEETVGEFCIALGIAGDRVG